MVVAYVKGEVQSYDHSKDGEMVKKYTDYSSQTSEKIKLKSSRSRIRTTDIECQGVYNVDENSN
eukprot:Pgem_evm1s2813